MESMQKCGISKKLQWMLFMDKLKSGPMITLITIVVLINLFAAYYYYNHITGRIDEARQLYEAAYGSSADFNSIFWLCQKIFTGGH